MNEVRARQLDQSPSRRATPGHASGIESHWDQGPIAGGMSRSQTAIVHSAARLLAGDGTLVASQLTFDRKEEQTMSAILKPANEKWDVAWRGFAPGSWQSRVNVREFIQRNYTPYEGDGAFLQGRDRAHARDVEDAAAAARAGAREGHTRRVADSFRHSRARSRLHRQGERDHRRPADRRAAEARDHAVRRLARGGGEPRVVRLQARRARRRNLHQVPQDAQRRRVRRLYAGHQRPRARRAS